jgi:hypothetical protein
LITGRSGRGVTANMLALGASDSGFESRRPDKLISYYIMKSFIKNKEDFTCEHCNTQIIGTGYTNHCYECFYSKHVDIQPGDRLEACGGLMKPVSVQGSINNLTITHQCTSCGFTRNNKIQDGDNLEKLAQLISQLNSRK